MDRRANHNSRRVVWMVMLAVAGALWNCGTVTGAAGNVFPVDGSVIPGTVYTPTGNIYTFLDARADPNAVSYVCYFSHIEAEVAGRVEDANLGPQIASVPNLRWIVGLPDDVFPGCHYPDGLVRGTMYYWAVDAFDADGNKFAGDIWEFGIQGYFAFAPDPPNEVVGVETDVLLSWREGVCVDEHDVYIGTSWDDVYNASWDDTTGIYKGYTLVPNYQCSNLAFNTKYYWRIDELCGLRPPWMSGDMNYILRFALYKGDVWCFTVERVDAQPLYPADGEVIIGENYPQNPPYTHIYTWLDFIPGPNVDKHTGYFSDKYDDVANRIEDANLGEPPVPQIPNRFYVGLPEGIVPGDPYTDSLVRGTTYYWTVDESDAEGKIYPGEIWEFTIRDFKATFPNPPNEAVDVETDVLLSWLPSLGGCRDVYLGTSWEDVNNVICDPLLQPPEYLGTISEPNILVMGLAHGVKYYWRVDELHNRCPCIPAFCGCSYYKGDVWNFTTEEKRIYVDIDANGANNGTNWENAYNYLHKALSDANSSEKPVEICVAQGIYKPNQGIAGIPDVDWRLLTFQLINGVILKGGYAGFGEPNPNARDIKLYETILSGDLNGNDIEVANPCDLLTEPTRAENSYHVVTGNRQDWPDTTVVVDGFTITGGNSNGDFPTGERTGGGMNFCSGKIINCTITGNSAMWGGGMCYSMGEIINCNIKRNFVSGRGGGISYSDVQMTNCTISENSAIQGGGGINNTAGDMMMTNCIFKGNTAREGGAIWYIDGKFGVQTLVNCTFSGNSAEMGGGAIYLSDYSSPTLINCILWGNSYPEIHGSAVVTYSDVGGGWPGDDNIDADPCFIDAGGGDFRLSSDSPCIDAGYNNAPNLPATDMDGHPRIIDGDCNDTEVVDIGAYEFNYAYMGDFDYDCSVDFVDFSIFGLAWMTKPGDAQWNRFCDISKPSDNYIGWRDAAKVCDNWLAEMP